MRYRDYIKNVASSEIYSTWPDADTAGKYSGNHVLCPEPCIHGVVQRKRIRFYYYIFHRLRPANGSLVVHIFSNISRIVDEIFNHYLSRPNVQQPILTQYCDGKNVSCSGWMTQWGSKYLGDQGYSPIEILRYYYGSSMYINSAEEIAGIPSSWPGYRSRQSVLPGTKVRSDTAAVSRGFLRHYPADPDHHGRWYFRGTYPGSGRSVSEVFLICRCQALWIFATWYKISRRFMLV